MTQPQIILKMLEGQPSKRFLAHELSNRDTSWGWLGNDGDTRARGLARKGLINREMNKETGYVEFWAKGREVVLDREHNITQLNLLRI